MRQPDYKVIKQQLDAALQQAQTGQFTGLNVLVQALANDNTEVRIKAAYHCQQIGWAGALGVLSHMAIEDPVSHNRNQAIWALVGIGRPAVVPVLILALGDEELERRQDARAALYQVLGNSIIPLLRDEDGGQDNHPEEIKRVSMWWQYQSTHLDQLKVYAYGQLASPAVFIQQLKLTTSTLPDAILDALNSWTGRDFGLESLPTVIQNWENWWAANSSQYRAGKRYYFGHPVPDEDTALGD